MSIVLVAKTGDQVQALHYWIGPKQELPSTLSDPEKGKVLKQNLEKDRNIYFQNRNHCSRFIINNGLCMSLFLEDHKLR